MTNLEDNFTKLQDRIHAACTKHSSRAKNVQLLAVSKRHGAESVRTVYKLGQRAFAENYLQEALEKQQALEELDIDWHFIGSIQKNKTRALATHFDWVHSVDRLLVAERLADQRPVDRGQLNICLQVNIDNEASKSGFRVSALKEAVDHVLSLKILSLRGLMAIPEAGADTAKRRASMEAMKHCFDELNSTGAGMDTLSMGMSADLEIAVQAGATMLRVGEALFGPRVP
ncbi:MAG: YggS family pyridoxal phosphate-dependent enzyme [Pseudomonadales bacterium]